MFAVIVVGSVLSLAEGVEARAVAPAAAAGSPIVVEGRFTITGEATEAPKGGTPIGTPYNRTWVFGRACKEGACPDLDAKNLKPDGSVNAYTTDTGLVRSTWSFHRIAKDGSSYSVRQGVSERATCVRRGKAVYEDPKGWTGEVNITLFVVKSLLVNGKRHAKGLDGAIVINGDYTSGFKAACGGRGGTPVGAPATGGENCICLGTRTVVEFTGTRR